MEFVNRFKITKDIYTEWVKHPIRGSKRSLLKFAWIALFVMNAGAACYVLYLPVINVTYLMLFCIFALFCGYRAFFRNIIVSKKQFSQAVYMQGTAEWERVTTFGEVITVADGCSVTQFDYDKVVELVDHQEYLALGIGPDRRLSYLRLVKNGFGQRTYHEFIEFLSREHPAIQICVDNPKKT